MAIYTKLSENNLKDFFQKYNLGKLLSYAGITEGIENTNYSIKTDKGKFILTVYEKRIEEKEKLKLTVKKTITAKLKH